jgi:HSP20 family protein
MFRMPFAAHMNGPSVDVEDKGDHYLVTVDAPGMDKKDLAVRMEGGDLVLEGKREEAKKEEDGKRGYLRSERYAGAFRRVIGLPGEVKAEGASAHYDKGVLTLKLPKAAEIKPASKVIDIH